FYWLIAVTPLLSQAPPPQKLSGEVASIKRSAPDTRGFRLGSSGGRFFATNVTLRILLGSAYSPHDGPLLKSRVIGVPDWIDTDRFDIEAKTEETSTGRIPQEK